MSIQIRKATIKDLPAVQELNNKLFELELANFDPNLIPNWPISDAGKEYFTDMIENHFVLVAEDKDKVVGYFAGTIGITEFYTKGTLAEIDNMFSLESYRGKGVGKMFFDSFAGECRAAGVDSIRATASAKNENAIASYKKWGFAPKNITLNFDL
jgi:GNAT superfamily N-acetyltransferase